MTGIATDRIRNIALIGHSGAGKTSLIEAMALAAGVIGRAGRVEDGNTLSDHDALEHQFHHSIWTSLVSLEWDSARLNLLDAPGYIDFEGEVVSALAAADAALVAVDASAGVEAGTEAAWQNAERLDVRPRAFVVTRLDREHANWDATVASIRARFGDAAVPTAVPGGESGLLDLLHGAAGSSDPDIAAAREQLIEAIAESDDDLLERYLEGETIEDAELAEALARGVANGAVLPIFPCCAVDGTGVRELLDELVELFPSPEGRTFALADGGTFEPSADGAPILRVFKTVADPFVGHISFVRVLNGKVGSGVHLQNPRARSDERAAHLYLARGREQIEVPELIAGDLGVIPKLGSAQTGDLLLGNGAAAVEFAPLPFPASLYRTALHPHRQDDVDKISTGLTRLHEQDPTIRIERDPDTGEMVLCTLGDVQASVAASRLSQTYGVEVSAAEPRVPYRETIRQPVRKEYRHKKQTGGRGQFGHVVIEVEPLPRGSGFQFNEKVVGGAVPRQFIPAVEQGATESMAHGPLTGSPLVDLHVTLVDGSSHSVDSSEMAFKLAASQALHEAVRDAQPVLLEPVMHLRVTVPGDRVGDITGEISSKRGAIQGVEAQGDVSVVEAQAPLAEIQRFTTDLRALTGGRGRFEIEFDHYAEVPAQVQERLVDQLKGAVAAS